MDTLICLVFAFLTQCGSGSIVSPATPLPVVAAPTATPANPQPSPPAITATSIPATPAPKTLKLAPPAEAAEVTSGNPNSKLVALTFDAGAGARYTSAILDALKAAGLRVTLFLTGQWADDNPELVLRMAADGHEFANHSYSHPDFTRLATSRMVSEIQQAEDAVKRLTGKSTKPFFRPPFGARDARVWKVLGDLGYYSIYWTLDSGDWRDDYTSADVLNVVSNKTTGGAIVVSHLDSRQTSEVLPQQIVRLQARGFRIVTLTELLSD